MKTIAIYFSAPGAMDYPFNSAWFFEAYKDIIGRVTKQGIKVVMVRGNSYIGNKQFSHYFVFEGDIVIKKEELITVDVIFNRDNDNTIPRIDDCPIINHPDFDDLCVDKYKTALQFPELCPKTAYVHSFAQCRSTLTEWGMHAAQRIVLKKNYLHSGKGIYVLDVQEIQESLYEDWTDILVQEFKDSSAGIPGVVEGAHDLRIYVINGKAVMGMIRTPKEGSWIANVAQGGTSQSVDIDVVDAQVLGYVSAINQHIGKYAPFIYAADFLRDEAGRYWLVELNSRPGVPSPEWKQYETVRDAFVDLLCSAV